MPSACTARRMPARVACRGKGRDARDRFRFGKQGRVPLIGDFERLDIRVTPGHFRDGLGQEDVGVLAAHDHHRHMRQRA